MSTTFAEACRRASDGPSIREIAKSAGVSPSTVSRVLNNRNTAIPIADETRRDVLEASRRLKYQPNIHAQRLFAGRSNSIAVMIPPRGGVLPGVASSTDPNLTATLAGIMEAATDGDQHLLLVGSNARMLRTGGHLNLFRSRSIDGMLIWGAVGSDWKYISELRAENCPFVMVNSYVDDPAVPHVAVANREGGEALARHLIELGHRRIAFLGGPESSSVAVARQAGFVEQCRESGVVIEVVKGEFRLESGRDLALELLSRPQPPTAIAAVDDLMALGVIEAARARGLSVPGDISVTGADDVVPYYKPRLTTFQAPMEQLGRMACDLLLKILEDEQAWPRARERNQHVIQGELIIGSTTGPSARSSVMSSDTPNLPPKIQS